MSRLLKDCGLEGCRGSVQYCDGCRRQTVHFRWPGGQPICGWCGAVAAAIAAPARPLLRRLSVQHHSATSAAR